MLPVPKRSYQIAQKIGIMSLFILVVVVILTLPSAVTAQIMELDQEMDRPSLVVNDYYIEENVQIPNPASLEDRRDWTVATEKVTFTPEFDTLSVFGNTYQSIDYGSSHYPAEPGTPRVPTSVAIIRVPTELEVIDVEYSGASYRPGTLPPVALIANAYDPKPFNLDAESYLDTQAIPPKYLDYMSYRVGDEYEDGHRFWTYSIVLFPVRYTPATSMSQMFSEATITYRYDPTPNPIIVPPEPVPVQPAYRAMDKFESGSSRSYPTGMAPRYIIITGLNLVEDLQPFADWKTQKGYPTEIYSTNEITSAYAYNDSQEEIKFFLRDKFNEGNGVLKYVLFYGDADLIPVRYCHDPDPAPGTDDGQIPSDSYYHCIGDKWDGDEDQTYGELGEIYDKAPDFMLGRMTSSDEAKIAAWTTLMIERETQIAPENWQGKAVLMGGETHSTSPTYPGDGKYQSQRMKNNYLADKYDIFNEYYDNQDSTTNLLESLVKPSLNSGASLAMYTNHGLEDYWPAIRPMGSFDKNDARGLTNGNKQFLAYSMACLTSWFDGHECIGEAFVEDIDGGAYAHVGHVRTATAAVGYNFYSPCASGMQEDFCRLIRYDGMNMAHGYLRAGGTHSGMKRYFANNNAGFMNSQQSTLANWLENTLFGEPDAHIATEAAHTFIIENTTQTMVNIEIDIVVRDAVDSSFVEKALVCIRNDANDVYAVGWTDSEGNVHFSIPRITGNVDIDLVVSKPNFKTVVTSFPAVDEIKPTTTLNLDPPTPDGENDFYHTAPTINLSTNEPCITYYRWGDTGPWIEYVGNFTAGSGTTTFYYWSVDMANNEEGENSGNILVDLVSPVTTVVTDPEEPNGQNGCYIGDRPTITLELTDDNASSVLTYYRWDSGNDKLYTGPITNAPDGVHKLYYHSEDQSGHVEDERYKTFSIDCSPPTSILQMNPIINDGEGDWYITPVTITLVSEADALIYYRWNDGEESIYDATLTAPQGANTLYYWAADAAGNVEPLKSALIKVDSVKPETVAIVDPLDPTGDNGWYKFQPKVKLNVINEDNWTTFYTWEEDSTSYTEYSDEIPVPEGDNTLYYFSKDPAGNAEEMKEVEVKYDQTVPETTLRKNTMPSDGWYRSLPTITLECSEDGAYMYYRWSTDPVGTPDSKYSLPIKPPTSEGKYTLYYYSRDAAGNTELRKGEDFNVDAVKPTAVFNVTTGTKVSTPYTFDASQSYDGSGIEAYYFDFGDGKNSGWVTTPVVSHNYSSAGDYKAKMKVRDISGQESEEAEMSVHVQDNILGDVDSSTAVIAGVFVVAVAIILVVLLVLLLAVVAKKKKKPPSSGGGDGQAPPPKKEEEVVEEVQEVEPVDDGLPEPTPAETPAAADDGLPAPVEAQEPMAEVTGPPQPELIEPAPEPTYPTPQPTVAPTQPIVG